MNGDNSGNARDWLRQGNALCRLGQFSKALDAYKRGLELEPQAPGLWNGKGNALNDLGHYSEALKAYKRGLELDPQEPALWNGKGNALNDLGHYSEALKACKRGLELEPQAAGLWLGKGNALNGLGHFSEALEAYERGLELDSQIPGLWPGKGNALRNLGRVSEALDAYKRGLELDPQEPWYWLCLAKLLSAHPEAVRSQARYDPQQCLCRAIALSEQMGRSITTRHRSVMIRSLINSLDLPLLWKRITSQAPELSIFMSYRSVLAVIENRVAPVMQIFSWLESDDCRLDECDRLLLRGRLQFHFGDAPAAYTTFDELDDERDPPNIIDQVYLTWAMNGCIFDTSAQLRSGLDVAVETTAQPAATPPQCYAAGHMFMLGNDLQNAVSAFESAAKHFLPARLMALHCRKQLGDEEAANKHLDELLKEEERRLETGERGMLLCVDPPINRILTEKPNEEDLPDEDPQAGDHQPPTYIVTDDGLAELELALAHFECSEAIRALRDDDALCKHPVYKDLVNGLGGGIDEWIDSYERQWEDWGKLNQKKSELEYWARNRPEGWVQEERARLKACLDWFDADGFADHGLWLAERLGKRIQSAKPLPDKSELEACIRLLLVEERITSNLAVRLILYVECRAVELHDQELREKAQTTATACMGVATSGGTVVARRGASRIGRRGPSANRGLSLGPQTPTR